ncbi:MAG: WG repeat-containing protein [Clostridiales bacterium]|nr:WG repeat-containing protein [Clostridiales bacterium]
MLRKTLCLFFIMLTAMLLASCTDDSERPSRIENLPRFEASTPPRFHPEPVTQFIPMDYGTIRPFLGQINQGEWGWTNERFGFIDGYGRIICDPIFNEVTLLSHEDRHAFVVSSRWVPTGDAIPAWERDDLEGFVAVISSNGSFFGMFDDVYAGDFATAFDFEFIPVKRDGKWGVIDFDGNQIVDFAFPNAPLFSDGLAAVFTWPESLSGEGDHLWWYFIDQVPFYYIDIHSNNVLGPFEPPSGLMIAEPIAIHLEAVMFHNGLAMNFHNERYGFIDTSGNVVIPHQYLLFQSAQIGWNSAGLALVASGEAESVREEDLVTYALIDRYGNTVVQMPEAGTSGVMGWRLDDLYTVSRPEDWLTLAVFDHAGNEIRVLGENHVGNGYFTNTQRGEDGMIAETHLIGHGIDRTFTDAGISWMFGDWFFIFDNEDAQTRSINVQTGELRDDFIIWSWPRIPNRNIIANTNNNTMLFGVADDDGNLLIDTAFDSLQIIGEYYFAVQGLHGGLIDANGQWVFRTTLSGNFD